MPAAWIGAGASLLGAVGAFGGSNTGHTGGAGANMYVPTGLGGADQFWQNISGANQGQLNAYGGLANIADQGAYQTYQNNQGINYQPYQQQQNALGQQYGNAANSMYGQANQAFGQEGALDAAGRSLWNTAQDPQNALYDRTRQQVGDQANAIASQYGLGTSGAGAGMAQQANENFNIDWQNQQLARQVQGAQGMSSLSNAAGGQGALGGQDLQTGLGYQSQASQIPLQAQQYIAGMPQQNAMQYAQGIAGGMAPYMQQQNQIIPYLNNGMGAGANAYQNTLMGNQFQMQNQLGALNGLGQAIGGLNTPNSSGVTPWSSLSSWFNQPSGGGDYGGYSGGGYLDGYTGGP